MATQYGFALLFPEQQRQNNLDLCFDWFSPGDNRRDTGKALSIRQMVAAATARHGLDPARVFCTGLSAGGAMTSSMLATYPEVFAGGAIITGLPCGCADTFARAFDRMRLLGMPRGLELTAFVRGASGHDGAWPTVSIWHGTAEATVGHGNAQAVIGQWPPLHGAAAAPDHVQIVRGQAERIAKGAEPGFAIDALKRPSEAAFPAFAALCVEIVRHELWRRPQRDSARPAKPRHAR